MAKNRYDEEVEDAEPYDEDLEDEEDLEDDQDDGRSRKRRNAFVDDAAEEDDEEEDEEEDRFSKRRRKASQFFDIEADVDDEDEDLEDEDEDDKDLIDDTGEDLPDEPAYDYHRRHADIRRTEDDWDDEQMEEFIKDRYQGAASYDVADEEQTGTVGQQGLLPTIHDPKLWVVEALPGQEREAVICLLQKCRNFAAKNLPLLIKSAFCQDHLKGYVYIEAYKESHVKEAISGLRVIRYGKGPQLVPIAEMVDAVSVNLNSKAGLEVGSWVRCRSGLYKGDLAKVVDVDPSSNRLWIKVIPRLDYAALAKKEADRKAGRSQPFGGPKRGAATVKPPARPFVFEEARALGLRIDMKGHSELGGREYRLNDSVRFHDGYLVRRVMQTAVYQDEGVPPLDEIQKFNAVAQASKQDRALGTDDLSALLASMPAEYETTTRGFTKGDRVQVVDGDLKGLKGRVHAVVEDGTIQVMPEMDELKEAIAFDAKQLQKYFASGDYVKVVFGDQAGQTGLVVRVEGPVVYLFSDATKKELRVFSKDLTEAAQVNTGLETFGPYELHDLVILDATTQGVIVGVDAESCRVLTNHGSPEQPSVRVCRLPDIKKKVTNHRRSITQDVVNNTLKVDDMVSIVEGRFKNESGTVKYVFRGMLWLHSKEWGENGGFKCVRARSCRVRGNKAGGPMMNGGMPNATPYRGSSVFSASVLKSPAPYRDVTASPRPGDGPMAPPGGGMGMGGRGPPGNFGRGGRGTFSGRTQTRTDAALMGKMVKIKSGQYRGYQGRVVSATDSHVRMELEAQYKTVTVKRECLDLGDGPGGRGAPPGGRPAYGNRPGNVPPTPVHAGGRTPLHAGSATPHHWGSGNPSATPHWDPSRTPSHDPTRTPNRDSAWNPNYVTPRHPSMAGHDTAERGYGYNAQTPAFNAATPHYNAQTPAYTPAETPAMTPGLDMVNPSPLPGTPGLAGMGADARYAAAPTPAAPTPATAYAAAPTPGTVASFSPAMPTPHMAPTPGSVNVNTPGFGITPAMTPGPMVAMSPAIPMGGMGDDSNRDMAEWVGVEVLVQTNERVGVVRAINADGSLEVEYGERGDGDFVVSGETEAVGEGEVQLVAPEEKDKVKVVAGPQKGQTGKLIAVDIHTGIVKLDDGGDVKLLDMKWLGRVVGSDD